jgi:hypothetical protein
MKNADLGPVLISNVPKNSPRRWVFGNSKPKGRGGKGKKKIGMEGDGIQRDDSEGRSW